MNYPVYLAGKDNREKADMSEPVLKWNEGEPPRDDRRYLLRFASGIVCSGQYRTGHLGEPSQGQREWRCDCCGRFATPVAWMLAV